MSDTERMSAWDQRRSEDREWPGAVRQYDGVILLVIAAVIIIGGVMTWIDRRDNTAMFSAMGDAIRGLTAEARGTKEILTRVEGTVGTLSTQNQRWMSLERETAQVRTQVQILVDEMRDAKARVQRIEDQRASERAFVTGPGDRTQRQ